MGTVTLDQAAAPIVIVGAGGHAQLAYEYFTVDSPHDVVAFAVEREYLTNATQEGLPVVALDELSARYDPGTYQTFVAISYQRLNRLRRRLFDEVKRQGFTCASFVSSDASVWRNVTIGENCFIFEHTSLQPFVTVGDNCVVWSDYVGHGTVIEDDVFFGAHVVVAGCCRIGARSFVGVNATFGDGLSIAEDTIVGAGAVVHKDIDAPRGVYVGNPARATGRDSFDAFGVES
ncbi:MAG TPA: acetyltransferase [Conexibacter sp.]|jgi:sugar O-acyltransferase (sialic acid O-acetyltransferase NeuD family)